MYPKIASDSASEGLSHTKLSSIPYIRHHLQASGYYLGFSPTGYRLEVSATPSLDLINMLEHLTGLSETLNIYHFIKGYGKGYESTAK